MSTADQYTDLSIMPFLYIILVLDKMVAALQRKKLLKQHSIKAERCAASKSIIVRNIGNKAFCDADALQMYFENARYGGGEAEDVKLLGPNEGLVTFKDYKC